MWPRRDSGSVQGAGGSTQCRKHRSNTKFDKDRMKYEDLLTGFIRLPILHHAAEHEIYCQWMIEELARHCTFSNSRARPSKIAFRIMCT